MIKLYGHPLSTCTRKVLCTLHETNTPFEFVVVDLMTGEHKQPAHVARQPFGQVPAIDDDGFALFESRAICRYLNDVGHGELVPTTVTGRAVMDQWQSVEYCDFTPAAMKLIYNYVFYPMQGKATDEQMIADGNAGVGKAVAILDPAWPSAVPGRRPVLARRCRLPAVHRVPDADPGQGAVRRPHATCRRGGPAAASARAGARPLAARNRAPAG
jgi:glutathione S-transferase